MVASSPEFFSARKTPGAAVVTFAIVVAFGLPSLALLAELAAERVRRGAGGHVHNLLRLVLVAGIALGAFNELDLATTRSAGMSLPSWLLIGAAAACGLGGLELLRRSELLRTFARFLAISAPAALALFLASVPMGSSASPRTAEARTPVPIVVVVFDELPTTSLLAPGGRIDGHRLPNFARLAREGTFYPNATTVADQTTSAVPSLLSGRRGSRHIVPPESSSWPDNLFTVLDHQYRLDVREPITRLCPREACPSERRSIADAVGSLASESSRLAVLSLAPKDMAPRSPLIGGASERGPGRDVADFLARVGPGPGPTLDFLHVMAPHRPWGRLPSGRSYRVAHDADIPRSVRETLRLTGDRALAFRLWRAHLLQVGFADRLLGRVISHLRRIGMYDRALVVVAADHGVSFHPGAPLRDVTRQNVEEIAPIPLFIKRPGGRGRGIDPAPAQAIDVLPTILDVIGAPAPDDVEGVSLLGPVPARRVSILSTRAEYVNTTLGRLLRRRKQLLETQRNEVIDDPEWRERCRLPGSGC